MSESKTYEDWLSTYGVYMPAEDRAEAAWYAGHCRGFGLCSDKLNEKNAQIEQLEAEINAANAAKETT